MANERVETGGMMSFDYKGEKRPELSEDKKKEIQEAYAKADERKKKEKRNKMIKIGIVVLVIILLILSSIVFFS